MRTNKPIQDLPDFARTFFAKHTLLDILTRYCVLTADRMLLVMRPYQIVATERILQPDRDRHQLPANSAPSQPAATSGTPPVPARP